MKAEVVPFLMFEGKAEEAMRFYVSLFEEARIKEIAHYGPGEEGPEGSVKQARFSLDGQASAASTAQPAMPLPSPRPFRCS